MPAYDFQCLECKKRFIIRQSYENYGSKPVHCPFCSSENVQRRIGRIRVKKSSVTGSSLLEDPSHWDQLDQEDPRALASMMRQMSREMDEDLPPELDEVVDRLEAGESPEDIEKELPVDNNGLDF